MFEHHIDYLYSFLAFYSFLKLFWVYVTMVKLLMKPCGEGSYRETQLSLVADLDNEENSHQCSLLSGRYIICIHKAGLNISQLIFEDLSQERSDTVYITRTLILRFGLLKLKCHSFHHVSQFSLFVWSVCACDFLIHGWFVDVKPGKYCTHVRRSPRESL